MDRTHADALVASLAQADDLLEPLDPSVVEGFHPWARGKPTLAVFRQRGTTSPLHLLVVDWNPRKPGNYYFVVFQKPTDAPLMEAHKLESDALKWRYAPSRHDGRNPERKDRFTKVYGGVQVTLPLPNGSGDVPQFVDAVNRIATARKQANALGDVVEEADTSVAAWIFQANEKYWDLAGALAELSEVTWLANQHADRMSPGDRVFLWQSGKGGGLLALGTLIDKPALRPLDEDERKFLMDDRWEHQDKALRVRVRVDEVLDEAVERDVLKDDPRLIGLGFLRVSQGTNFPVGEAEAAAILDLIAGGERPRVVKIAPGEGAKYWDDCRQGGYICVGWDATGDLQGFEDYETFRDQFRTHYPYNGHEPAVSKKSAEVWTLRELKAGDLVVANRGTSEILAIGTVVEPGYSWRNDREKYKHTVAVKWDTSVARRIPKQSYWGTVTVCDVPTDLYRAILFEPGETPEEADGTAFVRLTAALRDAGLSFSDEVVSAYLVALQAKRFVILSGISGTGKTQLALTVARQLGAGRARQEKAQIPEDAFAFSVKPYTLKYNRLVLPKALLSAMRLPESVRQGGSSQIAVAWPDGTASLWIGPTNNAIMISFSGAFRRWFQAKFSEGDPFYIELVEHDEDQAHELRFGIPKRVVAEVEEEPRYAVVAVRPDWTDNRGLLGYFNPILQQYVSTEFLRLLLRADAEHRVAAKEDRPPHPFFVVFDEMNLARVEHYFSDFLSSLESGEAIELHDDDEVESGEKSEGDPVPKRLVVPPNVYFTGTVNVDETTYMFSPKVLDRAFVLELNLVDLEGFSATGVAGERGGERLRLLGFPDALHTPRLPSQEDWEELGTMLEGALVRVVVGFHRLLERHNRHFGYRVANEIARMVTLATEECGPGSDPARSAWIALDLAILSKVLPKLHGTEQELADLIASLFVYATTLDEDAAAEPTAPYEGWRLDGDRVEPAPDSGLEVPALPRTAAKLHRMAERLRRQGFTSFIE